jgi:hypothetical protein
MPDAPSCQDCAHEAVREIMGRVDRYCRKFGFATCFMRDSKGPCGPDGRHHASSGGADANR